MGFVNRIGDVIKTLSADRSAGADTEAGPKESCGENTNVLLSAKLPQPGADGTIFENRLWESGARVEPWNPQKGLVSSLVTNTSELLEEIPSTLDLNDLSELPLRKEFRESMREREEGLLMLRRSAGRKPFLCRDTDDLSTEDAMQYGVPVSPGNEIYHRAAVMINDKNAPRETREEALTAMLREEIRSHFGKHGDDYDDSLPENARALSSVASWILEDADRNGIYIDLSTIGGRDLSSPLFEPFRSFVLDSANNGTDPGVRINPIYGRLDELNRKTCSSGIFGKMTFKNIIVASAAKTAGEQGSLWNAGMDDAGARAIMEYAGKCLFVERCTPRWHLSGMLAVAYQIYDLTGRWADTFPYFCKSALDVYMGRRYPDGPPVVTGREDALEAAWNEAGEMVCADCGKAIGPSDEMYIIRRTFRGTEGSESFFCPECAERALEEIRPMEKEGRLRIVNEELEDPLLLALGGDAEIS